LINLLNVVIFYDRVPPNTGWLVVVPMLIFGQIWVVIAEEFGWRGFALPRLQERYGSLGATLVLGPIWALWHLPMFFTEGSPQYSENVPVSFAMYAVIITLTSIIFTMLYNRSGGSVLACMLFHAFFNIAAFTIQVPPDVNITFYLIAALALTSIWFLDRPLFGSSGKNSENSY
jgi:membrane protease YdiL (CAAX protease family)